MWLSQRQHTAQQPPPRTHISTNVGVWPGYCCCCWLFVYFTQEREEKGFLTAQPSLTKSTSEGLPEAKLDARLPYGWPLSTNTFFFNILPLCITPFKTKVSHNIGRWMPSVSQDSWHTAYYPKFFPLWLESSAPWSYDRLLIHSTNIYGVPTTAPGIYNSLLNKAQRFLPFRGCFPARGKQMVSDYPNK